MATKYYFPLDVIRNMFVAQVRSHGSVAGCCIKIGISYDMFSKIKTGRVHLPGIVLDKLKLQKVCDRNVIKGYCSDSDIDWGELWKD